jgi:Uma2 family endonuclease
VIVEVLSPSTAGYDHDTKWLNYRRIPSLQDYLLVSQDRARVERFTRHGDGFWLFSEVEGADAELRLESLNVVLNLAEVYEGVLAADDQSA